MKMDNVTGTAAKRINIRDVSGALRTRMIVLYRYGHLLERGEIREDRLHNERIAASETDIFWWEKAERAETGVPETRDRSASLKLYARGKKIVFRAACIRVKLARKQACSSNS